MALKDDPTGSGRRRYRPGTFRRILVAYDGSPGAQRALRLSLDLAAGLGASVTTLTVIPSTDHLETLEERADAEAAHRADLMRGLDACDAEAAAADVALSRLVVTGGNPAGALARHVQAHGFDLLVLGNHGRERVQHAGPGRMAEQLLREPPCPLLIAPSGAPPR